MVKKAKKPKKVNAGKHKKSEERVTLESVDAVSSSDDEGADVKWNADALALRKSISEGAFDHLLKKKENEESDDEFVEVELREDEDDGEDEHSIDNEEATKEDDDESEEERKKGRYEDEEQEESGDEPTGDHLSSLTRGVASASNGKALASVYEGLRSAKKAMPWAETFSVVPNKPLPFADKGDIHDDLKRELAFYNMACEAANEARNVAKQSGVPFSRPEDFFAEMVKSDGKKNNVINHVLGVCFMISDFHASLLLIDHMAKVKDRLIFETKKMDAVAQRRSNKEQQLRAKEKQSNRLAEKSKRKKDHLQAVDDWAKSAAQNRGSATREDDQAYLGKMDNKRGWTDRDGSMQFGPNKKRMAADKKHGFGGKKGRFKQNDPKSLNDMSSFNPKGNFGGLGSKSKGGSGANRKGKRARDASRSRS